MGWKARIFDVATGQRMQIFHCQGWVRGVAFSPNGKVLATGLNSGVVQLWGITTGEQIGSALEHRAGIWRVAFSPDGNLLATVSGSVNRGMFTTDLGSRDEQTVRIWDIGTGPPYQSLELPPLAVRGKEVLNSFSKDGTILVSRHTEGAARIWRLPSAPADLREIQLRTWVGLGAERNGQEQVTAIPWEQWQKLGEELNASSIVEARNGDYYEVPLSSEPDLEEQERRLLENLKIQSSVLGAGRPNTSYSSYKIALLQLYKGDIEGYRKRCAQMLDHFSQTKNAVTAHWVAWTCVLAPNAVEDLGQAVKLAEQALESDPENEQHLRTLGVILYRAGRFDEALEKLSQVAVRWEETGQLPTRTSPAYTWYFLAMAHHRLGHAEEARTWLGKAVERAEKEIAGDASWNRKLTLRLLRAEAESMIKGEETEDRGQRTEVRGQ
jgi:tetratricopeptide (TPR) repeat protein